MQINGIEIRDIKDYTDVLTAFATINAELENLTENLDKNHKDYLDIDSNQKLNLRTQKEILEAINNLQIKAQDLISSLTIVNNGIMTTQKDISEDLSKQLSRFKSELNYTISSAINQVDLSVFTQQINDLFKNKVNSLEIQSDKLKDNNDKFNTLNNNLKDTIVEFDRSIYQDFENSKKNINKYFEDKQIEINESIDNFNEVSKIVNLKVIVSSVLGGVFIGGILMGVYGVSLLKDRMFKDEEIAIQQFNIAKAEMVERYKNAEGLQKFINDNGIYVTYNYFNDTKIPFLKFKIKQLGDETVNFDRNGNRFIGFKEDLTDLE